MLKIVGEKLCSLVIQGPESLPVLAFRRPDLFAEGPDTARLPEAAAQVFDKRLNCKVMAILHTFEVLLDRLGNKPRCVLGNYCGQLSRYSLPLGLRIAAAPGATIR
jgi:hypothetical protein